MEALFILFAILIFCAGLSVGFALSHHLNRKYGGTIVVSKKSGKTVYSLELDNYPEKLESAKNVLFRVVSSEKAPSRN